MLKLFRRQIHKRLTHHLQGRVFIFPLGSAFIIGFHGSNPLSWYSYTSLPESANLTVEYSKVNAFDTDTAKRRRISLGNRRAV